MSSKVCQKNLKLINSKFGDEKNKPENETSLAELPFVSLFGPFYGPTRKYCHLVTTIDLTFCSVADDAKAKISIFFFRSFRLTFVQFIDA